jgi:hypothetical protein
MVKLELLFLLMFCHWLADFTHISTPWMQKAKQNGKPVFPIFIHACVHGTLMCIVLLFFVPIKIVFVLTAFQICTHFCIDVLKGRLNVWFPSLANNTNPFHWYVFGVDQMFHQAVIVLMVVGTTYFATGL